MIFPNIIKHFVVAFGTIALLLYSCASKYMAEKGRVSDYVNPFIGTSTSVDGAGVYHGLGKTIPGATTPFGMVQVGPNTITGGDNGSGYSYEHTSLEGFAFTQMSGIGWYGDLGNFLVTPSTGRMYTHVGKPNGDSGYRTRIDKEREKAEAGYYQVYMPDHKINAEMTAAPHSGIIKFTFPKNKQSRIQIDLARRVGGTSTEQYIKVVDDHTISGWMKCTPDGGGWGNGDGHADYTVYFYATFSKPLVDYGIWQASIPDTAKRKRENIESDYYQNWLADAQIFPKKKEAKGKHIGFYSEFESRDGEEIMLKTGISFVDMEGAKRNLTTEISGWDFEEVKNKTKNAWNTALGKIKVERGNHDQKTVFYTALYRTMLDPRTFQDVDGRYPKGNGTIGHSAAGETRRTIFSGWDVFRSQMPLQTLINPQVSNDVVRSLIDLAKEKQKNYFERWELLNAYSGCMIGNPAVSVLADAYAKGIKDYDTIAAYRLAIGSVEKFGNGDLGYTPGGLSISQTLEYAYSEWCASQLARAYGRLEDVAKYSKRAKSYQHIFDPNVGWFRPKDEHGKWLPWDENTLVKEGFGSIESTPYQQGWFVPHDISGLAKLLGGKEAMLKKLTQFFNKTPLDFSWNAYYNHANEPVHHVPFLFNRLGKPSLTQYWTREICDRAYKNEAEKGLVGNEDVGQMSAWYVLAAIGLHPINPGDPRYELTSPVFNDITITLDEHYASGKKLNLKLLNSSKENRYIQSITWNGQAYSKSYINHDDLIQGGELVLTMGNRPYDGLETDLPLEVPQ